jgi:hypothetical protein
MVASDLYSNPQPSAAFAGLVAPQFGHVIASSNTLCPHRLQVFIAPVVDSNMGLVYIWMRHAVLLHARTKGSWIR